jgi:hypothetical protein
LIQDGSLFVTLPRMYRYFWRRQGMVQSQVRLASSSGQSFAEKLLVVDNWLKSRWYFGNPLISLNEKKRIAVS